MSNPGKLPKDVFKALNWKSGLFDELLVRSRVWCEAHFGSRVVIIVEDTIVAL